MKRKLDISLVKRIRKRLKNLGVFHKDAAKVAEWFSNQVCQQGISRALTYFKKVGDCILYALTGSGEKPSWVKTRDRFPVCVYHLREYPQEILIRVAKISRVLVFESLQGHQVNKALGGATDPYDGTVHGLERLSMLIKHGITASGLKPELHQPKNPGVIFDQFSKVMSKSGKVDSCSEPPLLESLNIVLGNPKLYSLPYWMQAFEPISPYYLGELFEKSQDAESNTVGVVLANQEPGGKLRMYAAPFSIVQVLLRPIHDWIARFRDPLDTDCTFDHESGAQWAFDILKRGNTVHSVDLSSATCRFPLVVQVETLQVLGLDSPYLDAFEWACKGDWQVHKSLQPSFPQTIRWTVGQPLGIVPSFSAFSLCHNLLLKGICATEGKPLDCFRILGDDVVISDDVVHRVYREVIKGVGVKISEEKSHSSDQFAEFAGFSMTREIIKRPGKWRQADIKNHLSISLDLGTPLDEEVHGSWLIAQKLYLWLNESYIPTDDELVKFSRIRDSEVGTLEWPAFINALPKDKGILRLIRKCGFDFPVEPPIRNVTEILLRKLDFHGIDDVRTLCSTQPQRVDIRTEIEYSLCHIYGQLSRLCSNLLITRDDYDALCNRVSENAYALFWLPPKSEDDGASLHRKMVKLLALPS